MTVSPVIRSRFSLPIGDQMWGHGDWTTVYDKYSREPAFEVALAGQAEVEAAVAAASAASAHPLPAHRRYEILMAAADGIAARRDALVETLVIEGGKPRKASVNEVRRTVETFRGPLKRPSESVARRRRSTRLPTASGVTRSPCDNPSVSSWRSRRATRR